MTEQLDLFVAEPRPKRETVASLRLEQEHAEARAIAGRLPPGVRFGTSSWSFPEWVGLVYPRLAKVSELAREGLRDYVRHPLLTTVGIDRGYYAPIPPEDLTRYAEQLPPGFPCCTKAPEAVTSAAKPEYLNPRYFEDEVLGPFREVFKQHAGPFLLQFPPAPASVRPRPEEFAEALARFLAALPRDFRYAVELRDPKLLTPKYREVLAAHGVAHVYNYVTAMPMPAAQADVVPIDAAPFAVIRLLLRPGTTYGERREEMMQFSRLTDVNVDMRTEVVSLARLCVDAGIPVSVLVNNKAEGCSPLTIRALAEMLGSGRDSGLVGQ